MSPATVLYQLPPDWIRCIRHNFTHYCCIKARNYMSLTKCPTSRFSLLSRIYPMGSFGSSINDELDNEHGEADDNIHSNFITTPSSAKANENEQRDRVLTFVAFKVLLPIVAILVTICIVLGIILIVKSYMMAPLKQNLATAIRRRRRVGKAPDNNYVLAEEMRASQQRMTYCSDRKSLPPPEVLLAARERMSQMLHI